MNALGRVKRLLAVSVVSALALALPAMGVAQAHTANFSSRITIQGKFRGDVKTNRRCRANRDVVLKKKRPGPDRTVGRDTTSGSGNWRISRPAADGRYYAIVTREVRGGYGHRHRCLSDRSGTIRV